MELRTLQYFLTVAREENITRASEVLHITQPTLSRQMKQLEQESVTCARFVECDFNNACAPLCAKGNIQLAGRRY